MELRKIKIARTRGGIFFKENFAFRVHSGDWANQIRNKIFKLYEEKKIEYRYKLGIDEDGDIEITRQSESRFTIYVSANKIVFESGAIDFNQKSYFVNELSSIIQIISRLMDIISLDVFGFQLTLAIPFKENKGVKGISIVEENYLRSLIDKLTPLGEEVKVSKAKVGLMYAIGPIEHGLTIENSRDDTALIYDLDNRCENPDKYESNYGKFIADVWEYYKHRFWPFAREVIEADFVDQEFLLKGNKE